MLGTRKTINPHHMNLKKRNAYHFKNSHLQKTRQISQEYSKVGKQAAEDTRFSN